MAVIGVVAENSKDEISQFQMSPYVSSYQAMWCIFLLAIHEKYPIVIHLAIHLPYSEMPRVYTWNQSSRNFNDENKVSQFQVTQVFSSDALGRLYTVHRS